MRNIPIKLAEHYAGRVTSLARLFKFKKKDGTFLLYTTADHDIRYSDGPDGELFYPSLNAASLSAIDMAASLGVDNAMMSGLITNSGLTEAQIRAGVLSHARWWVYEVNYLDLSMGHRIVASGWTGETILGDNSFKVELRTKTQLLKQPINESYELTCPVAYGSAACGKTFEWFDAQVDDPDAIEPDRKFTLTPGSGFPEDDRFTSGVMRVLSGDNAGAEVDVELQDGNEIELLIPLPYPLNENDEIELRIDCNKEARDEVGGCKSELRWGDEWIYHHRGFPDIPVAASAALLSPGAQIMGPGGGTIGMSEVE